MTVKTEIEKERTTLFVGFCNQKGGVGKSCMTVLVASYLYYFKGRNVAIVDCDFPQHSIKAMRKREKGLIESRDEYKKMYEKQLEKLKKEEYPIISSKPEDAVKNACDTFLNSEEHYDIIFFDLSGTVNGTGNLNSIINMDYIFVPLITDHMVMHSSLAFATTMRNYVEGIPEANLKEIWHFWNKVDKRENIEVYEMYNRLMRTQNISLLRTELPDSKRYKRELSFENRLFFRSTLFPPETKLIRGSNLDVFVGELCGILNI